MSVCGGTCLCPLDDASQDGCRYIGRSSVASAVDAPVLGFSWGSSTSVWTYRPNIERYLSAASDLSPRSSTPQRRCTELHSSVWTIDTSSTHSLANNAEHAQHAGAAGAGSGEVVVGLSGRERTRSASQSASRLLLLHRGTIYVLLASHGYANG